MRSEEDQEQITQKNPGFPLDKSIQINFPLVDGRKIMTYKDVIGKLK
jgi:hypothetical protein